MGGFEPPIPGLGGVGSLAALGSTGESYQMAIFLSVQGHLAGLVALGLNYLD